MDYVPKGIVNLGNTCFLNAVLQILSQSKELNKVFDSKEILIDQTKVEKEVYNSWNDMRLMMHNSETKGQIVPRGIIKWFLEVAKNRKYDGFVIGQPCDTSEFLQFFVDCLHECLKRSMNITVDGNAETEIDKLAIKAYTVWQKAHEEDYSELKDLFFGIMVSSISAMNSSKVHSHSCEIFFTIDLPVSTSTKKLGSIYECLDVFTEAEEMVGKNAWYNDQTKTYEDVKKHILFWNLPSILVICLKRFSMDGMSKENHSIKFPLELDMNPYVCGYNRTNNHYELFGVCNHFGNLHKGHYTNYVKNKFDVWYHCNDEIVQELKDTNQIQSLLAYCLFYRKKNSDV